MMTGDERPKVMRVSGVKPAGVLMGLDTASTWRRPSSASIRRSSIRRASSR